MLSHIVTPPRGRPILGALAALSLSLLVACGGARPRVHVIGVAPAAEQERPTSDDAMVVFLEVVNRTGRQLELSRLEYQLSAPALLDARGKLSLRRSIDADSSAVVEIPVNVAGEAALGEDVPYELRGRIVAREDRVERSWEVEARGHLRAPEEGVSGGPVRVHVAAGQP